LRQKNDHTKGFWATAMKVDDNRRVLVVLTAGPPNGTMHVPFRTFGDPGDLRGISIAPGHCGIKDMRTGGARISRQDR
jgi:hypothetical protein